MNTVINAFHPDFMKTYYPDFTKEFRTVEANQKARLANPVKKAKRIRKPKVNYKVPKEVKTRNDRLAEIKKNILGVKPFHTFAKAGMPKGVH
jgi:hypothetical protein